MSPQGNGNRNENAGYSNANSGNNLNYQNYASNNNSGNNSNDNEKCTGAGKLTPEQKRRKQQLKRIKQYLKFLEKTGNRNPNKRHLMREGHPDVRLNRHSRKGRLPSQLASGSGILSQEEFMCAAPEREFKNHLPQQGCMTYANAVRRQKLIEGQKAIAESNRRNKERQKRENERKKQRMKEIKANVEKRRQQQQSGCKHEANAGSEERQSRPTNSNNRYKHEGQERLAKILSQGNPSSKIPKMWGAMSLPSTGGFKLGPYIHKRGLGRRQCPLPSPGNAAAAAPVPRNAAANKKAAAAAAANKKAAAAANKKAAAANKKAAAANKKAAAAAKKEAAAAKKAAAAAKKVAAAAKKAAAASGKGK